MNKKKNQHFVPRFYFRFFSSDQKRISLLNLKSGKTIKYASIKNQCSKNYFYGNKQIENALAGLENEHRKVLKKLRDVLNLDKLTEEQYMLILQAVLFQRSRTMAGRQKRKGPQDKLAKLHMEVAINNDSSLTEKEKYEYRQLIQYVEANPQSYQGMEIIQSLQGIEYIIDLYPLLLINKTKYPFIFGDAPVVFYNNYQMNVTLRGVLGAQTPGLQIFYPISQNEILLVLDPEVYQVRGLKNNHINVEMRNDVDQLNKLQLHNSLNSVYFSDYKCSDYIRKLWRQEKESLAPLEDRFVEAPGFDHDGNPLGDIVHVYEPMLPFRLKLSFLRHDIVDDENFKFQRRHEKFESDV